MRVPGTLALLGEFLDMRVEDEGRRFTLSLRGTYWLCADEKGAGALWVVPAPRGPGARKGRELTPDERGARRVFKRFNDYEPERVTAARVRLGEERERGRCASIAYRSSKWSGRPQDYEHTFEARPFPRLVQCGQVYRLTGGRIKVTAAGIVG